MGTPIISFIVYTDAFMSSSLTSMFIDFCVILIGLGFTVELICLAVITKVVYALDF